MAKRRNAFRCAPLFAPYGLYSGAFHPTAEGHAIVADHVIKHARELLEKRAVAQN